MEAAWTPADQDQSAPAFNFLYNDCCKGGYFTKKKHMCELWCGKNKQINR